VDQRVRVASGKGEKERDTVPGSVEEKGESDKSIRAQRKNARVRSGRHEQKKVETLGRGTEKKETVEIRNVLKVRGSA